MKVNLANNRGQSLVEYALILILVALVAVIILRLFGTSLAGVYSDIVHAIQNPQTLSRQPIVIEESDPNATIRKVTIARVEQGNDLEVVMNVTADAEIVLSTSSGRMTTRYCLAAEPCVAGLSDVGDSAGVLTLSVVSGNAITATYPSKLASEILRPENIPVVIAGTAAFMASAYGVWQATLLIVRWITLRIAVLNLQLAATTGPALIAALNKIGAVALTGTAPALVLVSDSAHRILLNLKLHTWEDQLRAYELARKIAAEKLSTSKQINALLRLGEHYALGKAFPSALSEIGLAESLIPNIFSSESALRMRQQIETQAAEIIIEFDRFKQSHQAWGVAAIEGQDIDAPLILGQEYSLLAGIEWNTDSSTISRNQTISVPLLLPGSVTQHQSLQLEVLIVADGFAINPNSIQILEIPAGASSNKIVYTIRPLTTGSKKIEIRYYFHRHWIQSIVLNTTTVEPYLVIGELTSRNPVLSVGLVLGEGGKGDQALNDSAHRAAQSANEVFNVDVVIARYVSEATSEAQMRKWVKEGRKLIIGVGEEHVAAIAHVAASYPAIQFALLDATLPMNNVWSAVFSEYEGDYIVGKLAAFVTERLFLATGESPTYYKEALVGFIGGRRSDTIERIEAAFRQGIQSHNTSVPLSLVV